MKFWIEGEGMTHTEQYIINKYKLPALGQEDRLKWIQLKEYILQLGDNQADRICIFCAGERGRKLYWDLKKRLIQIDFFADNNKVAEGYVFDNTYCVTREVIRKDKDRVLILVALAKGAEELVTELRNDGFLFVENAKILDQWFEQVPEVAWLSEAAQYDIGYSDPAIIALMDEYRNIIFDMCKYYEERD